MRPGCEILCYNEDGETKFMFYDGRGSNVAGLDIFGNELYSNEYGPMGEILYSIDYSNIIFGCSLYDNDLGSYIELTGAKNSFSNFVYSISKDLPTFKKISLILKTTQRSSGPPTDWVFIGWPIGSWDCIRGGEIDLSCLIDLWTDGGGGGGDEGDDGDQDCSPSPVYFSCSGCDSHNKCHTCCGEAYTKCMDQCDLFDWGIIYMGFWETCRSTCDKRYSDCGIDCDSI